MDTIPVDEFHGQGGCYVMDPKTGKRKLVQRTEPAAPTTEQPTEPPPADDQPAAQE